MNAFFSPQIKRAVLMPNLTPLLEKKGFESAFKHPLLEPPTVMTSPPRVLNFRLGADWSPSGGDVTTHGTTSG